ncbi:response regulator [uncultured Thiodictyon sp.]|uniref:response regulator n=1 Tax=uncultured Thiodictyon sp. TaxID=1846217 RepID=UPI0026005688|nr:response regulator [uncultured Thiodictyon sp.]
MPQVLIVDDDPMTGMIFCEILAGMGSIHVTTSGASALQFVAGHQIDLVLLDIMMPEMDGFATCRALLRDYPDIPVVFVTAANDPDSEIQALGVGGHDVINKPVNPPVVRARVALHLKFAAERGALKRAEQSILALNAGLEQQVAQRTAALAAEIAERKYMETALRDNHELLSLFVQHSPIYAYIKEVTAQESRVLIASENFQGMVGVPGSKMVGKAMGELFPDEVAAKISADDWAVASSGQPLRLDEDFNGRHYTTLKFPIIQGERKLLAGYTIDVTERNQAEAVQRAYLAERARAEERESLLHDMHDGFASQLATAYLRNEHSPLTRRETSTLLRECLDDFYLVVDTLGEDEKSLNEAIADYRYRCDNRLSSLAVQVDWEIELSGCPPIGQRITLNILRILQEALNNAINHAQAQHIRIAVLFHPDGRLRITVADDGVGIAAIPKPGRGLPNMQKRARNIGMRLAFTRLEPGTIVSLSQAPNQVTSACCAQESVL